MKTKLNYTENGMVTIDALIFANRNQAYGAYELRKKYKKHLFIGLFFASLVFTSGISVPLIMSWIKGPEVVNKLKQDEPLIITKIKDPNEIVPPKPEVKIPEFNRIRAQAIFVVDTIIGEQEPLLTNEDIAEVPNAEYEPLAIAPVTRPEDKYIDDDLNEGIVFVQESATFQGGDIATFRNWVQSNTPYPEEAILAEINGKVFLEFCVNTKGRVCDVKINRGLHPSIDNEVIRTLMNSPEWTPAKQNGRVVKQKFSFSLAFIIKR